MTCNETVSKTLAIEVRPSEDGSFCGFVLCKLAVGVLREITFCFDAGVLKFLDSFLVLLDDDY